ncbi:HlyD family secretion protein [Polaromonas sp. DSR2-3-2]|uniref:HlyD family secretion protein n=1 Tax=unclassified Polaromonas TaxID=2638319 RepID=UPI003CED0E07
MKPLTVVQKRIAVGVSVLVLGLAGYLLYRHYGQDAALPEGLIQANGRIEGDRTSLASKLPGRIAKILVNEGDTVQAGQVLAMIEDTQVKTRVAQLQAQVAAAEAQVVAVQAQLDATRKGVPLTVNSAGTGVGQAQAVVAKATAAEAQAQRDAQRMQALFERGSVARQRAEMAELAATAASADLAAARQGLNRSGTVQAEARLGYDKVRAQEAQLTAARAQRDQAKAGLAEVDSVLADLSLKAAGPGVVMTRVREIGEVIAAGSPVFDLVDLDRLYLKVYVPEVQIGKVRINLPAQVYSDAFPERAFAATVGTIASRAEFTPKEVQTPDERVKLTYAVKLYLTVNPDHQLTPGLPADAVIRWKDGVAWAKPRW